MAKDQNTTAITVLHRHRAVVPSELLAQLDRMEDRIRIGKVPYARFTFRGVPGRRVDIIIAESVLPLLAGDDQPTVLVEASDQRPQHLPPALTEVMIELGEKAGKYDGEIRRRYALHAYHPQRKLKGGGVAGDLPVAKFQIFRDAQEVTVLLRPEGAAPIVEGWQTLRSDLRDYNLPAIVHWHAGRYYPFLPHEDVRAAADAWAAEAHASGALDGWTLAEANRSASRYLYRLARDLGWRKLTIEERDRLGLAPDAPQ